MSNDDKEPCSMYIKYKNGKPVEYRYGEPWVQTMLFFEGGYETPEEAVDAWEHYITHRRGWH